MKYYMETKNTLQLDQSEIFPLLQAARIRLFEVEEQLNAEVRIGLPESRSLRDQADALTSSTGKLEAMLY